MDPRSRPPKLQIQTQICPVSNDALPTLPPTDAPCLQSIYYVPSTVSDTGDTAVKRLPQNLFPTSLPPRAHGYKRLLTMRQCVCALSRGMGLQTRDPAPSRILQGPDCISEATSRSLGCRALFLLVIPEKEKDTEVTQKSSSSSSSKHFLAKESS